MHALAEQFSQSPAPFTQGGGNLPSTDTIARREKIFRLQAAVAEVEQWEREPIHTYAPGSYARTLVIDKGIVIIGKIHKHAHINVIAYGHCLVFTEHGGLQELHGPLVFASVPGTKRAVLALEETHWTTVHITEETDLEKIEDHVIAKSYEDYEQFRLEASEQLQMLEAA